MTLFQRPRGFGSAPLRTALAHMTGLALVSGALLAGGRAHAAAAHGWDSLAGAPAGAQTVSVGLGGGSGGGGGGGASRNLSLPRGKSAVIELPVDARDVLVSNPKIADVVLSTPRRIYVLGQAPGQTDATFIDGMGRQILRLNVRVDSDTSAVAETLNHILPGSSIHVEAVNDRLILSGEAANAADADKALRIAQSFVEKPEQVLNMIAVASPEQVMLKVRIVEVNRQIIKQLGVNLQAAFADVGTAASVAAIAYAPTFGVSGTLLGGASGAYNYSNNGRSAVQGVLEAFEQSNLVRTLAEPNLTAVSGESAKFLAGGEFPVPVAEDNEGRVTVEFKQFGVGLGFTPVVLSNGRISLKLSTEYSELTNVGAFSLSSAASAAGTTGSSGGSTTGTSSTGTSTNTSLVIPGLNVRRAETVVELPSGGAMMIAGLLESTNKQSISSLPGLTQLPVLGALFRSRDYLQGETELVVIVTPYLVKPSRPDQLQTPADGLQVADDGDAYLLGHLNSGFNHPAAPPPRQELSRTVRLCRSIRR